MNDPYWTLDNSLFEGTFRYLARSRCLCVVKCILSKSGIVSQMSIWRLRGASLSTFLLCLDLALWSESANSASKVEMGGGENLCERIEQGRPASSNQRTHF